MGPVGFEPTTTEYTAGYTQLLCRPELKAHAFTPVSGRFVWVLTKF